MKRFFVSGYCSEYLHRSWGGCIVKFNLCHIRYIPSVSWNGIGTLVSAFCGDPVCFEQRDKKGICYGDSAVVCIRIFKRFL